MPNNLSFLEQDIEELAAISKINGWVNKMSPRATLRRTTSELSVGTDRLGSGVPVFSVSGDLVVGAAVTPLGNQSEKRKTRKEVNPLSFTSNEPQVLTARVGRPTKTHGRIS